MSRTYRRSGISDRYYNLEFWEHQEIEYDLRMISGIAAAQVDYGYSEKRAERIKRHQDNIGNGIERVRDYYAHFRDGRDWPWLNSSLGKAFRDHCNRDIRSKTRHLERKVLMDAEVYDNLSFPDKHNTKHLYWCYD